jgi:DNA polymerase III epsilon subunit-like protein
VSVVDEEGGIILDTLVNPEEPITRSLFQIHGVRREWLNDAPTLTKVREHL